MGTIAKGEITLVSVNDAYTVSLTPSSCVIKADFDGSNPQLDNAKSSITVKRGTKEIPFKIVTVGKSSNEITVSYSTEEVLEATVILTGVSNIDLEGWVEFSIITTDGFDYQTTVRFFFSIVRESTMLDWIQDWEGGKTKLGSTYIMTPKLFVGKKEDIAENVNGVLQWKENALTGVYLGPDLLASGESSVGIYGYLQDNHIFHINSDGGYIGGWTFNETGMQSSNNIVRILSEGSVIAQNPNAEMPYWGIYADGHATFANGNVVLNNDGSAEFSGKITSTSGTIGGWSITTNQIIGQRIGLDSKEGIIGVWNGAAMISPITNEPIIKSNIMQTGGAAMYYVDESDYGFVAYSTGTLQSAGNLIVSFGSKNFIAGWNLNGQAIWAGSDAPYLTQGGYATESGAITISPNGLRSCKWYIDANGTASFVGGSVKFNTENASMFGWLMRSERFSANHAALVSNSQYCGLFISPSNISEVSATSLSTTISNNGGICLFSDGENSVMRAYDKNGNLGFQLNTIGLNKIANWYFNDSALYLGSANLSQEGFTATSGSMALLTTGIYGYKWRLQSDGSGALAGGNITWDVDGKVTFSDSVSLRWNNVSNAMGDRFTYIDTEGLYTGTISADKISAGTISTASIKCEGKWELNTDGSGFLASNNITWDIDGNTSFSGTIIATAGTIGGFEIASDHIGANVSASDSGSAGLSIYNNLIAVGGSQGSVIFGDNVVPSTAAGAMTAVGRIANSAPNTTPVGSQFDQINCGLNITVTGAPKNYGIYSNAALLAPAFISTKANITTITTAGYSIDFAQQNIVLLYFNQPNYSEATITLPSESNVASSFGVHTLPDDFATVVLFRVREGSLPIILQGIYNADETTKDYKLAAGDSLMILISKIDGFRYQVISHSY